MLKREILSKLKQRILLFKVLVPDSFWLVSNVSLGGRVTDRKLWMSRDSFQSVPAHQGTNKCSVTKLESGGKIGEVCKVT